MFLGVPRQVIIKHDKCIGRLFPFYIRFDLNHKCTCIPFYINRSEKGMFCGGAGGNPGQQDVMCLMGKITGFLQIFTGCV